MSKTMFVYEMKMFAEPSQYLTGSSKMLPLLRQTLPMYFETKLVIRDLFTLFDWLQWLYIFTK